ncbi:MAG: bifunctional acetate--CoA ligase family protein/GNAT family N-acetyltransferase [Syntrophaceae bacterium]|nr:bifunctional acetate--CoA ligase family protein/GNAT family N-acetyltransferase [Syntrophaceae bacterium]
MIRNPFEPKTIAVIDATDRVDSPVFALQENILASGIRLYPVHPERAAVSGIACYPTIGDVPEAVDMAVIATPAADLPGIAAECGRAGVGEALVVTPLSPDRNESVAVEEALLEVRKVHGMRILGPGSLGFIRPSTGLNLTPFRSIPEEGAIALVAQGVAFGRTLFEWGMSSRIGFSMFISLGSMLDVDFGDVIDLLGNDPRTRSIMIYMEDRIGDVKKFMSAARGFSRNKPVVLLKPPHPADGEEDSKSHTGALAGPEEVYDAVFRRAGVVRVGEIKDLFNTAGVLYARRLPKGPRLAVVSNSGGAAAMAVSRLLRSGGQLARPAPATEEALRPLLPRGSDVANPLDIFPDADVERYVESARLCIGDDNTDGALVIFTPQEGIRSEDLAAALADLAGKVAKPVIATWLGDREQGRERAFLAGRGVPSYDTPEEAVRTYLYMYRYERNLELLYETPAELTTEEAPPKNHLRNLIRRRCGSGITVLTEDESRKFLASYGIRTVGTAMARSLDEAVLQAERIGYPVVLKVVSPDVIFRPDVGGIAVNITSVNVLREEYESIMERVRRFAPRAEIRGVTVQKMIQPVDFELILGSRKDKTFGAVILFGMGGVGVRVYRDFSLALPPLNQALARRLMEDTRIFRMLQGYRGKPPADLRQLEEIIVNFSNLVVDFPEIMEMDVNPIVVSRGTPYALGARIIPDPDCLSIASPYAHLSITPYPSRYVMRWNLPDGLEVVLRPIRPEDEPLEREMFASASEATLRERYYHTVRDVGHMEHARSCNIDYDREMTLVAEIRQNGQRRLIGTGGIVIEPHTKRCEFAILVHDEFQGRGLAYKMLDVLIGIAGEKGLREFFGYVEKRNLRMLRLCEKLGMVRDPRSDDPVRVVLALA